MRTVAALAAGLAALTLSACSASETDFKEDAEKLINDDDGKELQIDFDQASCEEPASTETGSTFSCTAVGEDGQTYTFTGTITDKNKYSIQLEG
jgi:hypothetical protein